jgi:GTP cyclohydrolase I
LSTNLKPSQQEVEEAVKILIRWIGDDPNRSALKKTPARVARAYQEMFAGYQQDPESILATTFKPEQADSGFILVKNIRAVSHCEHHMLPFIGTVHIGYVPGDSGVLGLSKFARLVEAFSKRLQTQERLTYEIAREIDQKLKPKGVKVMMDSTHYCMSIRGVQKHEATTLTSQAFGCMKTDQLLDQQMRQAIDAKQSW